MKPGATTDPVALDQNVVHPVGPACRVDDATAYNGYVAGGLGGGWLDRGQQGEYARGAELQ
jgi:hypothetical protein